MAFKKIAAVANVLPGETKVFEIDDVSVVVGNVDGTFYAVEDRCSHDNAPLGEGILEGCQLECPRHGARFDIRTGAVLCLPAVTSIRSFPVRVSGDDIELSVAD